MNIEYRQLLAYECEQIKGINPSRFIKRAWRKVDGIKQWVDLNWKDDDYPNGYGHHFMALKTTFEGGGFAMGAFDGKRLIGFTV